MSEELGKTTQQAETPVTAYGAALVFGQVVRAELIGLGFDEKQLNDVYEALRTAERMATQGPASFSPSQEYLLELAELAPLGDGISCGLTQTTPIPNTRIENGRTIYYPEPTTEG